VYIFFWSKADDPPNKSTPKNQVQNKVLKFGFLGGKYGINGLIKGHQGVQKCSVKFRQCGAL